MRAVAMAVFMRCHLLPVTRALRLGGYVLAVVAGLRGGSLAGADAATIPEGWFVWPSVEPVAGTAPDQSALNARPAGAAGRILVRDGVFATPDGERVRFWGCNLSAEVAFPPVDQLPALARRLAKGGVNIARLHHLDNEWAVNAGGSLWPRGRTNHEQVDPSQLDRVFRLVAALKAEGIYSNLNLKVSRSLVPADGFPASVTELPLFQKRVDIFDARMIELQKAYARQLLTTKNPYTGLTLAEDPAVAIIELNNENSLLGFWTRDLGRGLDRLPEPWRGDLTAKWNAWLAARYTDDTDLGLAWSPANSSAPADVLPAEGTWIPRLTGTAAMTLESGENPHTLVVEVTQVTGVDWHAQVQMHGIPMEDGESYAVTFRARAEQPRTIGVGLGLDARARPGEPWRSFGLLDRGRVGTAWTTLRFAFTAHSTNGAPACLQFNVGQATGRIEVADIVLTRGAGGAGLLDGQSARDGTVPIPTVASRSQWADWIHFLADTERAYADEMRRYLREELGVTAPMICSQVEYGGLTGVHREQEMEFLDTHAYWEHPVLENGDFDSPHWTIGNSPQLAAFARGDFAELGSRALLRVAGKPFALSEYDHSAPSEYAAEMYPTLATYAALQDWDAVYPFDIGMSGSRNRAGTIGRFFDQLNHPAKWGQGPFAARVFRQSQVVPLHIAQLNLPTLPWRDFLHADLGWRSAFTRDELDLLNTRFELHAGGDRDRWQGRIVGLEGEQPPRIALVAAPAGSVYVVGERTFAVAVGYIGGADVTAGDLRVVCDSFGLNFAAVNVVALDDEAIGDSRRLLVTVVGRAQNQDITWNEDRTSLGANWGHGPPIVEHVPATITLAGTAGLRVFALAPDGTRAHRVRAKRQGDDLTFVVSPRDRTIHYEVAR